MAVQRGVRRLGERLSLIAQRLRGGPSSAGALRQGNEILRALPSVQKLREALGEGSSEAHVELIATVSKILAAEHHTLATQLQAEYQAVDPDGPDGPDAGFPESSASHASAFSASLHGTLRAAGFQLCSADQEAAASRRDCSGVDSRARTTPQSRSLQRLHTLPPTGTTLATSRSGLSPSRCDGTL